MLCPPDHELNLSCQYGVIDLMSGHVKICFAKLELAGGSTHGVILARCVRVCGELTSVAWYGGKIGGLLPDDLGSIV